MTRRPPTITTVLLDADGVEQTSGANFTSSVERLCPDPSQSKAFLADVFIAEKPCLTGTSDFPTALERVLDKWKIDTPTVKVLDLWSQIIPVTEILDAVTSLRGQGVQVCLASNQQAHRASIMTNDLGYIHKTWQAPKPWELLVRYFISIAALRNSCQLWRVLGCLSVHRLPGKLWSQIWQIRQIAYTVVCSWFEQHGNCRHDQRESMVNPCGELWHSYRLDLPRG